MSIENKLQELGIVLPNPAKPAGSYKPCVIVDNIAYISGQGPLLEDGSFAKGVVGKDLSLISSRTCTKMWFGNIIRPKK